MSIGDYAFKGCINLQNIVIPSSVTSIGNYAFCDCKSLAEIIIPSSVTSIGDMFVSGCTSIRNIIIPQCITNIGILSFENFSSLKEFVIPSSSTSINYREFSGCKSLSKISIPSSITYIGQYAFYQCESLEDITIPSSVKKIDFNAFKRCTSLKRISIEPSTNNYNEYAIPICASLMENGQLPNYRINKNTIILDGTYHKAKLLIGAEKPTVKIIVIGSTDAGKTCYLNRYFGIDYDNINPTIAPYSTEKDIVIADTKLSCCIWDTSGQSRYQSFTQHFYQYSNCAIVMFDLTNINTFEEIHVFINKLYQINGQIPAVLIGNKCDCESERVSGEKIDEIVNKYNCKYFEVSAIKNLNVKESMEYIVGEAFQHIYYKNIESKMNEEVAHSQSKCNIA